MLPTSPRLSETAYDILNLAPDSYRQLVPSKSGKPEAYALLSSTDPSKLVAGAVKSLEMAQSVAAGLWLWHDYLDESHKVAQGIDTESGSFWHAIMHRREGDFSNSKYWLAKCREHPARQAIGNQAALLLSDLPADNRMLKLTHGGWNAEYFVDLVEQHHTKPDEGFVQALVILQQLEWRVLIEYCASMA